MKITLENIRYGESDNYVLPGRRHVSKAKALLFVARMSRTNEPKSYRRIASYAQEIVKPAITRSAGLHNRYWLGV